MIPLHAVVDFSQNDLFKTTKIQRLFNFSPYGMVAGVEMAKYMEARVAPWSLGCKRKVSLVKILNALNKFVLD